MPTDSPLTGEQQAALANAQKFLELDLEAAKRDYNHALHRAYEEYLQALAKAGFTDEQIRKARAEL